jgi:GTP-binding protein
MSDLYDALRAAIPAAGEESEAEPEPEDDKPTRIAIVGRPNAGKSSILNRITGEERALVSELAGTTRDAVDTPLAYNGRPYVLIDTAGIRRKSKVSGRLESMSVVRSIRAIDRADVVFLVIDAVQGLTEQDARLADLAAERGRPVAIVVNKWDLFPDKETNTAKAYTDAIHRELKTLAYVPVVYVSALVNQRVHKLMALAESLALASRRRAETSAVNQALRAMVSEHTPALIRGKSKRVKFYFATQVAVSPPTIVVFCNVASEIQESYIRYMTNRFRERLGFTEVPIRIIFRPKSDVRKRDAAEEEAYLAADDSSDDDAPIDESDAAASDEAWELGT